MISSIPALGARLFVGVSSHLIDLDAGDVTPLRHALPINSQNTNESEMRRMRGAPLVFHSV